MISPKCEMCGKELEEFGAIILSPPEKGNMVIKDHICKPCYIVLCRFIDEWCENNGEN